SSNGRGKIDVAEQLPGAPKPAAAAAAEPSAPAATARPGVQPTLADRMSAVEKRLSELEAAFTKVLAGGETSDRVEQLETRINSLHATVARAVLASEVAGPGLEPRAPALPVMRSASTRRSTAVEAYADGM